MREIIYSNDDVNGYLYRRKNDFYYLYLKDNIKRIRKSLATTNYFTALRKSFNIIDAIKLGVIKTPTFSKVSKDFIKTIKQPNKQRSYQDRLDKVFIPAFKDKNINEITEADINQIIFARLEKIKPQSVNKEMVVLKQLFKYAKKCHYIFEIPEVEKQKEIAKKRDAFTDKELQEILKTSQQRIDEIVNARNRYDREVLQQYILFLMATGIRTGEALSIQFKNINEEYAMLGRSKTLKREIYLNKEAQQVVVNLIQIYSKYGIKYNDASCLFLNFNGEAVKSFKKGFNALLAMTSMKEQLGKNTLTLYSLRHYYITNALKSGIPLTSIAIQCGTSVKMIQKNYNHLTIYQVKNDLK